MRYRRFGQTNLQLSVFSLGMMHCCHSESNLRKTLTKAISLGINHFETAKAYGKSEEYLGIALQKLALKREQIIITTKLIPTPNYQEMEAWIEDSLTRLKVKYIDCIAIHGINTWEHLKWIKSPKGFISALLQAKKQGKVKHIGFSTHGSLELILATLKTDLFEFINLHYYYFFQRNLPAVKLASQKDLGIFIISPADKGGRLYNPPEKLKLLSQPYSPLHLSYRFLLANPSITTLSVGAAIPEELVNPLQVADQDYPLTEAEKQIIHNIELELAGKLNTDLCQQCYKCLPCPENINIPEILRLRNLKLGLDMSEYGKYRYVMLENAGHWFAGNKGDKCTTCGDCLPRCPQKLNIPELLFDSHKRLNGISGRRLWE